MIKRRRSNSISINKRAMITRIIEEEVAEVVVEEVIIEEVEAAVGVVEVVETIKVAIMIEINSTIRINRLITNKSKVEMNNLRLLLSNHSEHRIMLKENSLWLWHLCPSIFQREYKKNHNLLRKILLHQKHSYIRCILLLQN